MKKFILFATIFLVAVMIIGCKDPEPKNFYIVKYQSEQGVCPSVITVTDGYVLKSTQLPVLSVAGFTFLGWYDGDIKAEAGKYIVTKDVILVAKWITDTDYIIKNAEIKAAEIISNAEKTANEMINSANKEIQKMENESFEKLQIASISAINYFNKLVISEFNAIIDAETSEVYNADILKILIPETVKAWAKKDDVNSLSVLLSEKDLKELEKNLGAALKLEINSGLEIKLDNSLTKGFRIERKDGVICLDCSSSAIAGLFSSFLDEKLLTIMEEAISDRMQFE